MNATAETTETAVTLTKKQLTALLRYVSSDRVNLNQLWIQDGYACATDGHRAVVAGQEPGVPDVSANVGRGYTLADLTRLAKGMRAGDTARLSNEGVRLKTTSGEHDVSMSKHDFPFPPLRQVFPSSAPSENGPALINARYLGDVGRIIDIAGREGAVRIETGNGMDGIRFTLNCGDEAAMPHVTAIVMPMKP